MMAASELSRVQSLSRTIGAGDVAVEVGCWLGEATKRILTEHAGEVHLIDTFEWSRLHDARVPGVLELGADFSALMMENLASYHPERLLLHKGDVVAFDPSLLLGHRVGLLLLDGPKDTAVIASVLDRFRPHMAPTGAILVKHAISPFFVEIVDLMVRLIEAGVLRADERDLPGQKDTMFVFQPDKAEAAPPNQLPVETWLRIWDSSMGRALSDGSIGLLAPLVWLLKQGHAGLAKQRAEQMLYAPRLVSAWVEMQDQLAKHDAISLSSLIEIELVLSQ